MQMEWGRAEKPMERWRSRGRRSQEAAKTEEKLLVKQAQEKRVSGEAACVSEGLPEPCVSGCISRAGAGARLWTDGCRSPWE